MFTIVDSHNKVLSAWAEYRNSKSRAPRLITLDHHTDTSMPFRSYIKATHKLEHGDPDNKNFKKIQNGHLGAMNFAQPGTIADAIKKLSNDEHIVAAIKTDIISSAFVIAHNAANTDLKTYNDHRIICREIHNHDTVLESALLDSSISEFDKVLAQTDENLLLDDDFILDIDLDYFNTFKSIDPVDLNSFKALAKQASLVTIATEPEYVKSCALDKELTSEYLLEQLIKYLAESGHKEA